ncbi:NAD(P)-dependent oxidoreductase [Rhizobium sp. RCC_161_2]|uniref:NAD(P)-dependent oxidoreductase n=1 Tax=Rhizobium sp. RCC_161_2 TaxID=3239219 RepID=UPI0035239144
MRAVFADCTEELRRVIETLGLQVPSSVRINHGTPTEAELIELCSDRDVLFVEHTSVPASVFAACPSIRAVIFMGTGAGTYLDLDDATQRGVEVMTTPGYGDRAVAEHTFALMFAAARNIATMDRDLRAGEWKPLGGLQLENQKIAVIGLGGIGATMADLASSVGMRVSAWNRTRKDNPNFVADIDEALDGATVVSLHLSLSAETCGIIDLRRIMLPARGFILVNTARAALVDEHALLEGLSGGQIGHAALDVFPEEPLRATNPYTKLANATVTAHAAYMTDAAYAELWNRTLKAYNRLADRSRL